MIGIGWSLMQRKDFPPQWWVVSSHMAFNRGKSSLTFRANEIEGAVHTSFSLKTMPTLLANVIVRVGSTWMGRSGSGAEVEGIDGRWGLKWMSGEDEHIMVGPGANPGS